MQFNLVSQGDYTPKIYQVSLSSILNIGKQGDPLKTFPLSGSKVCEGKQIAKERVTTTPSQASERSWKEINKEYLKQVNVSADNDDIYSIAPELIDPTIPLRSSLELVEDIESISKKNLKVLKKAEVGLSGKVKFVRFKNDNISDRWFAIKRPMSIFQKIFKSGNNIRASLKYYENNLNMALKIGNHSNFMKVRGIVVKEKSGKEAKPYLILEYIEGVRLRDIKYLSLTDNMHVLSQLKNALTHLFELGILPIDANHGNFLITKDNVLKIIDFDAWKYESAFSEHLAYGLYDIACSVAKKLTGKDNFNPSALTISGVNIKRDFEKSIINLITQFSSDYSTSLSLEADDDLYSYANRTPVKSSECVQSPPSTHNQRLTSS
ncbi:MAG: protein kinase family protein [Candidatus Protochlamydia sp.]|nr:protein kinase family protein [Candidatus Protochlamydia sp.]